MANVNFKGNLNVVGKFYVDCDCIDCDNCQVEAPESFSRNRELGRAFVKKQPSTQLEFEKAKKALEHCPVDAIGNDGN